MRDDVITTVTKRKVIVTKVEIKKLERFRTLKIKLPANVKKVTGILVTASATWHDSEQ